MMNMHIYKGGHPQTGLIGNSIHKKDRANEKDYSKNNNRHESSRNKQLIDSSVENSLTDSSFMSCDSSFSLENSNSATLLKADYNKHQRGGAS